MVRFVFSVEDLVRTRFAISPMWELVRSLVVLRDPAHAALHVPWLRSLDGRLDGGGLKDAIALLPPRGYTPDLLTPPPAGPLGSIEEDLAALRATGEDEIRSEMALFASQHPRADVRAWLADPAGEVRRLADPARALLGGCRLTGLAARARVPGRRPRLSLGGWPKAARRCSSPSCTSR